MVTWSIYLNGSEYSRFYSKLRSLKHEQKIVSRWKEHFASLGRGIPDGELRARPYISTKLDNYGD